MWVNLSRAKCHCNTTTTSCSCSCNTRVCYSMILKQENKVLHIRKFCCWYAKQTVEREREGARQQLGPLLFWFVIVIFFYSLLLGESHLGSQWVCTVHTHTEMERAGHELCISLDLMTSETIVNETEKMPFRQFGRSVDSTTTAVPYVLCVSVYLYRGRLFILKIFF